jgi:hypothetical protein
MEGRIYDGVSFVMLASRKHFSDARSTVAFEVQDMSVSHQILWPLIAYRLKAGTLVEGMLFAEHRD